MATLPVLIVGAGPVGLTCAFALRKHGVRCRVIDKAPHRTEQSRAAIIHARTMEVLERLGLAPRFLARGVRARGADLFDGGGNRISSVSLEHLPTAYPFFLGLTQSETERLLTEALGELGVEVERQVELESLRQDSTGVSATLRHDTGREETVQVGYLVGCDGGKSTVRHQLGLKMEGETLDAQWLTADVKIDWDRPADRAAAFLTPSGFAFIAPMDRDRWRIVTSVPGTRFDRPEDATLGAVQELLDKLGVPARLYDPVWISPFAVNTRLVETMRVGRVFLAGDAAHVHSPAGGQGMNTGIQDAFNLAWKLALVLGGRAGEPLLASYHAERHANARRMLGMVGPATILANLKSPAAITARNAAARLVGMLGGGAILARRISELDVHYRESPIVGEHQAGLGEWLRAWVRSDPHPTFADCWDFGRGPRPGERAPDAHGLTDGGREPFRLLADWIDDPRHQLLVFTGLNPKPKRVANLAALAASAEQAASGLIRSRLIRPADVEARGGLIDAEGDAHHLYGARYECLYLIRPDGYVGFRSQPVEWNPFADYWRRLFPANPDGEV